jgi:hypothetical protein
MFPGTQTPVQQHTQTIDPFCMLDETEGKSALLLSSRRTTRLARRGGPAIGREVGMAETNGMGCSCWR